MKVFTTGIYGMVSPAAARALGLPSGRNQARVLIAARNKVLAHQLLTERHLEVSMSNPEFRLATGTDVDLLDRAGMLDQPGVLAVNQVTANSPVVRVGPDHTATLIGHFKNGGETFAAWNSHVPDDERERVAAEVVAKAIAEEKEITLAKLASVDNRIGQLEQELNERRAEKYELIRHAVDDLDLAAAVAEELDITVARVGQLRDKALQLLADRGTFLPGLYVRIQETDRKPANYPAAIVVEQPADSVPPEGDERWVWVRYGNGCVVPVRQHRVLASTPPCSTCPADKQLHIVGAGTLAVHLAGPQHRP